MGISQKDIDRFWAKVDTSGNCWTWTGCRYPTGYGKLKHQGTSYVASRFAWIMANGDIPNGLCVLHRCDNPPCVRPDHLFLGTKAVNNEDMRQKRRQATGIQNGQAKITDEQVRELCHLHDLGWGVRRLARRFGISRTQVTRIVRGEQRLFAFE